MNQLEALLQFISLVPAFLLESKIIYFIFLVFVVKGFKCIFKKNTAITKKSLYIAFVLFVVYCCCTVKGATRLAYSCYLHPFEAYVNGVDIVEKNDNIIYTKSDGEFTKYSKWDIPMNEHIKLLKIGPFYIASYGKYRV